jgi:hypothetical protein
MTYTQDCDSTAQPMRAGGSDISQRAGSQGSWTTGLLHINSMGSDQASNPHSGLAAVQNCTGPLSRGTWCGGRPPGSSRASRGRPSAPVAEGPAPGPGGSQSGRSGDGERKSTETSGSASHPLRGWRPGTSRMRRPLASRSSRTSRPRIPTSGSPPIRTRPGRGAGGTARPARFGSSGTPRDAGVDNREVFELSEGAAP